MYLIINKIFFYLSFKSQYASHYVHLSHLTVSVMAKLVLTPNENTGIRPEIMLSSLNQHKTALCKHSTQHRVDKKQYFVEIKQ
jgi:hypothetical protein